MSIEKILNTAPVTLDYTETTNEIRVSVVPEYIEDAPEEFGDGFAFAYTVSIENHRKDSVQLIDRHWVIHSGGSHFQEVKGEGVVGLQPLLEPGESFQYTSWSVIRDPQGTMRGSYTLRSEGGEEFQVQIPEFDLVCPEFIH